MSATDEDVTSSTATQARQNWANFPEPHRLDLFVLAALCGLYLLLGITRAAATPFWADELATVHIAAAPSWHAMLAWSRLVDLNPPLEPSLVRLSFRLLGPHELAGRLPSIVGFTGGVAAMYLFLRRRVSLPYALLGALLPLTNDQVAYYLTEARPYALLFGCVGVAVLAYDSIVLGRRVQLGRLVLALALTGMLQAHLFGSLAAGTFVAAEVVRTVRSRRLDALTSLAILLPWLSCFTYLPLLHGRSSPDAFPMIYEEKDRTSLRKGVLFYDSFLYLPIAPLCKVIVVVLLCLRFFPTTGLGHWLRLRAATWTVLLLLLATPVGVALLLHVHAPGSGFYPRYSIAAVCPAFLLLAGIVGWRGGGRMLGGWVLAAAALLGVFVTFAEEPRYLRTIARGGLLSAPVNFNQTAGVEGLCPDLPLVMNYALDFFQADYRLGPSTLQRMVYVTDPALSLRVEHETATESVAGMAKAFQIAHHVVPAQEFLAVHRSFLVLSRARHQDWFLDYMRERRARIEDLGARRFAGEDERLWFVALDGTGAVAACAASSQTQDRLVQP